ncbi:MAG: methionyl-tRNA formyltransferase, partial [Pseudanabaenaceae cyanobacterium]
MRIVFFGTPTFAVPTLEALLRSSHEVLGVITQPDARRGRGNQLSPSPVKAVALAAGLPIWQPPRLKKDPEVLAILNNLAADGFVVVAYGQILPPAVLALPRQGCINVHGSLLPKYRGAAPIQWSLANGETETGVTTMLMDAGIDTGAMLLKAATPIDPADNAETLSDRLAQLGARLLLETLDRLPQLTPIPQ